MIRLRAFALACIATLLAAACDDGGDPEAGASCEASVRALFVRREQLLGAALYCPSELPAGMRLITDAETLPVRLRDDAGRELSIMQGPGQAAYLRRDTARCAGCFEVARQGAMFGDLPGRLYALDPPAVYTRDVEGSGHMLTGAGFTTEEVVRIAAAMRPVSEPHPLVSRLLPVGIFGEEPWLGEITNGQHDETEVLFCDVLQRAATLPSAVIEASYNASTWPYEDGHPPVLQQTVMRFERAGAEAHLERIRSAFGDCPAERIDNGEGKRLIELDYPKLGDETFALREETETAVQSSIRDMIFIRKGDLAVMIEYTDLLIAGDSRSADAAPGYAREAANLLDGR